MTVFGTEQERKDYFSKFEKIGETEIRIQINMGEWQEKNKMMLAYAQEWLRLKDEARALEASSKRDARETETLKIAKRANRIAWIAATSATVAAIAAIIAAIIDINKSP